MPAEDTALAEAASAAYVAAGVPEANEKSFDQQLNFTTWGAEVRGGVGRVGTPLAYRRQLWILVRKQLASRWTTKNVMQRLLGFFGGML